MENLYIEPSEKWTIEMTALEYLVIELTALETGSKENKEHFWKKIKAARESINRKMAKHKKVS